MLQDVRSAARSRRLQGQQKSGGPGSGAEADGGGAADAGADPETGGKRARTHIPAVLTRTGSKSVGFRHEPDSPLQGKADMNADEHLRSD